MATSVFGDAGVASIICEPLTLPSAWQSNQRAQRLLTHDLQETVGVWAGAACPRRVILTSIIGRAQEEIETYPADPQASLPTTVSCSTGPVVEYINQVPRRDRFTASATVASRLLSLPICRDGRSCMQH